MSGLILPNRFTSQPPASTLVDQAKAKELGVVYLAVANESGMLRDVIGGKDIVNPGGSSTGHTGRVWTFNGAQQSNKAITLDGESKLFVCARIKATAAQAGVPGAAFGVYNSGSQSGFGVGFSGSNQVGLAWLTNAGAGIDAYSTGALNAWYDVYTNLEIASVGKRAWINGSPATTTQGSSVTNWITGQNEIAVGAQHRSSGFLRNFTGHIEWAAVLILDNTKIDDALSARLYADRFPYNLFKSQSRRIFVASAGGAAALASNAAAQASASAAATTAIPITAAALSIASASGALSTAIPLAGVAASQSTASASLTAGSGLSANAQAASSASGALTAQIRITANALAQAISSAALSSGIIMSAAAVSQAAAQGTLATAIQLIANATGQATATANLTAASSGLSANAQASASASAALTIQIRLSANAVAQASAQGALTAHIDLSANALAAAIAAGSLTAQVTFESDAFSQALAMAVLSGSESLFSRKAVASNRFTGPVASNRFTGPVRSNL